MNDRNRGKKERKRNKYKRKKERLKKEREKERERLYGGLKIRATSRIKVDNFVALIISRMEVSTTVY